MQPTTSPQQVAAIVADLITTAAKLNANSVVRSVRGAQRPRTDANGRPWLAFAVGAACALAVVAALY